MMTAIVEMSDEELVGLCQEDIDNFRSNCQWICPCCGHVVPYSESLFVHNLPYIHEIKCQKKIYEPKINTLFICGTKMNLAREDGKGFCSSSFDVLFGRYRGRMIKESSNYISVDSFEEIYSTLMTSFTKIVAMFARDKSLTKKSDKWFSSFFWRSVKNRIVDIRKMNSYTKRTPSVVCECCNKSIGQITAKHLFSEGHKEVLENIFYNYGHQVVSDTGEISYYNALDDMRRRAIRIGKMAYSNMDKKEKKSLFDSYALKSYYELYPNAYFSNRLLSVNAHIGEDDSSQELEVYCNKSVLDIQNNSHERFLDQMNMETIIDNIMDMVFKNGRGVEAVDNYFKEKMDFDKKTSIIRQIIFDKISYTKLKNVDSDKSYSGIKKGLTSAVMKTVKENKECRNFIYSEVAL